MDESELPDVNHEARPPDRSAPDEDLADRLPWEPDPGDRPWPPAEVAGTPTLPLPIPPPPPPPFTPLGGVGRRAARRGTSFVVAMALVAALIGGGIGTTATLFLAGGRRPTQIVERVVPQTVAGQPAAFTGVAAVAQKVMPSIVRIDVTGSQGPFGLQTSATGSGVIMTSDGYILTNNHVVDGASSIEVTLSTGDRLPAKLVGTAAPVDDIAVIKVDRTGLPAATLGSIANLKVGDLAVAIGSPFGLQGTVTSGVISALHRNIDLGQGEQLTDAIQTDAPINPGNSGGALVDANGAVIGINTAILGNTGGNVGVGFAIPIDLARRDADQIIRTGRVQRAFLGITGESVPNSGGALIQQIVSGGPAARAGLHVGDIIVGIQGTPVHSMDDLIGAISQLTPGQRVSITYRRGGQTHTTTATLTARPPQ